MSLNSGNSLRASGNQSLGVQSFSDPYEVIQRMNRVIQQQKAQIQNDNVAFDSLMLEKQVLESEKKRLENMVGNLQGKVKQLKYRREWQSKDISPHPSSSLVKKSLLKNLISSPTQRKIDKTDVVKSYIFEGKDTPMLIKKDENLFLNQNSQEEEFVPQPIKLKINSKAPQKEMGVNLTISVQTSNDSGAKKYDYGENLIEDFAIIGPQINQFKNLRHSAKNAKSLIVKSHWLLNQSKFYKEKKVQFLNEIAIRAFPEGCKLTKKLVENHDDVIDIISYKPSPRLNEDYFIFTLKGDESLLKGFTPRKNILGSTNPNYFLYVICLKVPEFVYVRDQKNYHRKESEIWVTEKIYTITTYYPFFNIFIHLLSHIHSLVSDINMKALLLENENPFMWNLTKNVYDFDKNEAIRDLLTYFSNKKPDYSQICHQSVYFGTMPEYGFKAQYATALFCCPIFFSHFAYEEFLLLLTAIFCQKTIIFLSKSQTVSTLSALFLVNLISPFQFSYPLLLNCDSQKVKEMIFEFPFSMICSIKKTEQNLPEIMYLFAESNVLRTVDSDAQYIVVDIDSNTILYHSVLDELFNACIVSPSEQIRKKYVSINPCESKNFSLPKPLPKESVTNSKNMSQIEKREQEKKKYAKQYIEKINSNMIKMSNFKAATMEHEELLKKIIDYIQTYTLGQDSYEILSRIKSMKNKNNRNEVVKEYLLHKNKDKEVLISYFLESQMYANYLDSMLEDSF